MDYQSLTKLISNKYGLRFTALPTDGDGAPKQGLALEPGQAPFIVLSPAKPVHVDVQCFSFADAICDLPGFGPAFFHHDEQWVGFILEKVSDRASENIIDYAFKAAVNAGKEAMHQQQYVVLPENDVEEKYQAQVIPQPPKRRSQPTKPAVPKEIERALVAYDYSLLPGLRRDKNFYDQGQILADYQDDFDRPVPLKRYFPTYHMLSVDQLRTYFAWRTKLRQGVFTPVSTSYAYIYIYELLNNIGVVSPMVGFKKLTEFRDEYAGHFDGKMGDYLDRWLRDYVLYYQLDHALANKVFAAEIAADRDYHVLLHPDEYDATDLVAVFKRHATYLDHSRLYQKSADHFAALLKVVWQGVLNLPDKQGQKYFDHHVASQELTTNYFFGNAVFYFHPQQQMAEYPLDSVRRYRFKGRQYYCLSMRAQPNEKQNLNAFLHEVDRLVRLQFKLGRPLKARWLPAVILNAIDQGIREYQRQLKAAHRPKVHIDLGGIDQIRQDAAATQESLLTDKERQAIKEDQEEAVAAQETTPAPATPQPQPTTPTKSAPATEPVPPRLNADQAFLVRALLKGKPWKDYLKKHHLMASIVADQINEAFFDEIGDDVIEFDQDDQPAIIEDYRTDLEEMFSDKE